jgi:hypothetical protein
MITKDLSLKNVSLLEQRLIRQMDEIAKQLVHVTEVKKLLERHAATGIDAAEEAEEMVAEEESFAVAVRTAVGQFTGEFSVPLIEQALKDANCPTLLVHALRWSLARCTRPEILSVPGRAKDRTLIATRICAPHKRRKPQVLTHRRAFFSQPRPVSPGKHS